VKRFAKDSRKWNDEQKRFFGMIGILSFIQWKQNGNSFKKKNANKNKGVVK